MTMRGGWCVYILQCGDGSYYTGITNNIEKRLKDHRDGRGSRYVRSRMPFDLVYAEAAADQPSALRREAAIKKMKRADKLVLIELGK